MYKSIKKTFLILIILLSSVALYAELQFVDDFEGMSTAANMPYNIATAGGGGIWSTNTGGTSGNIYVETNSGSTVIRFMTTADGVNSRGFGFADIDNTIDDTQSGILFFRFSIRAESNAADTYFGMHALNGTTPFGVAGNDPEDYIVAGFRAVNGDGSAVNLVKTKDAGAVLASGLVRGQWYNCWIDADNAANTFDLYLSTATGPAGAATLPMSVDKVGDNLPFENTATYGASTLMGAFFDTPRLSSTTRSTTQSARTYIDEVYWDGDEGLPGGGVANIYPSNGQTRVPVNAVLSWDPPAETEPNFVISGYDVYFDVNELKVENGESGVKVATNQAATTYDPFGASNMAYETPYFWRVDVVGNFIGASEPNTFVGSVFRFTTKSQDPIIDVQPANQVRGPANGKPDAEFSVTAVNATNYQWYKDNIAINGATGSTLTITGVQLSDEGQYYCVVSNQNSPVEAQSNTVWLEYARQTGDWAFEGNADDSIGGNNGTVFDPNAYYDTGISGQGIHLIRTESADGANGTHDPNGVVILPVAAIPPAHKEITISLWTKHDPDYINNNIVWAGNAGGSRVLNCHVPYGTSLYWDTGNDTDYDRVNVNMGTSLVYEDWNNFVFTKDTESGVISIYANGVQVATEGGDIREFYGAVNFLIGGGFAGVIDDLKIYNYALDAIEVAYLYYDATGEKVCIDDTDPVLAAYDFNGNCKIDLPDFAELAINWLHCQQVPDCIDRP